MAFTGSEKIKILKYLCFPGGTIDPTNVNYSKIISDRLTNVSADLETEIREVLAKIIALDTKQLNSASQAGVKKIDDIEFFGNSSDMIKKDKNRYVNELSGLIDIPNMCGGGGMGNVCI